MKKSIRRWLCFMVSLTLLLGGCGTGQSTSPKKSDAQGQSQEIIVSAAASLKDSLTELEQKYRQRNPGVKVTFNFGASGTLQHQIEQGAPADLFISAGKTQIDTLKQENLLIPESVVYVVGNDLVLIVGKDNTDIKTVADLTKPSVQKISIGTPETVPAGKYAQESLTHLQLWEVLQPKLVLAKDVTQVLSYVETGNVEAGLVYQSDAQGSTKVKVVATVPDDSHQAIVYPAGIVAASKNQAAAKDFLQYLRSSEAQQVFTKYGFKPSPTNQ